MSEQEHSVNKCKCGCMLLSFDRRVCTNYEDSCHYLDPYYVISCLGCKKGVISNDPSYERAVIEWNHALTEDEDDENKEL